MSNNMIHIHKITEHEDGSATLEVEMLQESYRQIFEYGLRMLFVKAVEDAGVMTIRPMTKDEREAAREREEANSAK